MTDDDDDLVLLDFRLSSGKTLLQVELTRGQALAVLDGYMRLLAGEGLPPVPAAAAPPRRKFKVLSRS